MWKRPRRLLWRPWKGSPEIYGLTAGAGACYTQGEIKGVACAVIRVCPVVSTDPEGPGGVRKKRDFVAALPRQGLFFCFLGNGGFFLSFQGKMKVEGRERNGYF